MKPLKIILAIPSIPLGIGALALAGVGFLALWIASLIAWGITETLG